MNRPWLITILIVSILFLTSLESLRQRSLNPVFKAERSIKLKAFAEAKKGFSTKDQELLELWESMLTGRVAPVSKWMKERYKLLGLNHLFTPSGFHLSAVLYPVMKFVKNMKLQLALLMTLGLFLFMIPGQGALKRMVLIKSHQKVLGLHFGFIAALILDCLVGTFQTSALSFTYSFLFLGIIYSGLKGVGLVFWFFIAQMILAYFQGTQISPLLLVFSPILNFAFGLSMPVLFLLAIPLWNWQAELGLMILRSLQAIVDISASFIEHSPVWEIHFVTFILMFCFITYRWKVFGVILFVFSSSLNWDQQKVPGFGQYEFRPQGNVIKVVSREDKDMIYFNDGRCDRKLVRGIWYEKCSPKRGSTRRKKIMKLSSL